MENAGMRQVRKSGGVRSENHKERERNLEYKTYENNRKSRTRIDKLRKIMDNRFHDCAGWLPCYMEEVIGERSERLRIE